MRLISIMDKHVLDSAELLMNTTPVSELTLAFRRFYVHTFSKEQLMIILCVVGGGRGGCTDVERDDKRKSSPFSGCSSGHPPHQHSSQHAQECPPGGESGDTHRCHKVSSREQHLPRV